MPTKSATTSARASGDAAAVAGIEVVDVGHRRRARPGPGTRGRAGRGGRRRWCPRRGARGPSGSMRVVDGLGDATVVDDDPQAHVGLVAGHVLVDAAVGEAGEGVGALPAGDERLGAVPHQLEHAVAGGEAAPWRSGRRRVPRHQRTPTRTSVKRAGHRGVAGVADLDRLALAAVRGAPEHPLVGAADHVHRGPEPRADAGVGGVAEHLAELAVLDLPGDLAAELEVEPLVVDRPGAVGVHVDAVVGGGDHLLEAAVAREEADVGHAHHRQAGGTVGAHHAARTSRPTRGAESRPESTPTQVPSLTMSTAWAGTPSSSNPKLPSAPGQGGVGGDVHEVGAVAHRAELGRVEPRGAGEGGLPAEDPVELDGVAHRLVDLERHLLAARGSAWWSSPGTAGR